MTVMGFFGCAFLAFGPPLAMFTFTIAHEPIRIIVLSASAFVWLISLLLSSMLWYIVVPLQGYLAFGLVFSVIFQETFRYLLYWILRRAEKGLNKLTINIADCRDAFAYVCGLGFGFMSGSFALINILADGLGPGTLGLQSGNEYFFIVSSATTLCFILLHTFWSVIFFSALDRKKWGQIFWVVGSHLFVSCMTLLNRYQVYTVTLLTAYTVLVLTAALAFKVAGGRTQFLFRRNCLRRN